MIFRPNTGRDETCPTGGRPLSRKDIGRQLFAEAHGIAAREGCGLAQLTTDHMRADTMRFYEQLGYECITA